MGVSTTDIGTRLPRSFLCENKRETVHDDRSAILEHIAYTGTEQGENHHL